MPGTESEDLLHATTLLKAGQVKEATALLEKTLSYQELTYGEDQPELTSCLAVLSDAYVEGGRLNDALRISKRQLELARAHNGEVSPAAAGALLKMCQIIASLGRTTEGLTVCRQSLETAKQCMREEDPLSQQIIKTYNYLLNASQGSFQNKDNQAGAFTEQQGQAEQMQADAALLPDAAEPAEAPALAPIEERNKTDFSQIKAARKRTIPKQQGKEVLIRRLSSLIMPVLAIGAVIALLAFFLTRPRAAEPVKIESSRTKSADRSKIHKRYLSTDDKAEIRLLENNTAILATADSAVELPYHEAGMGWNGLTAIIIGSVTENQKMLEKRESILKGEKTVYYSMDGPERQVIAKMRRLAGFAQSYYLRMGEYPRLITNDMLSQFCFLNPVTGKNSTITLKTFADNSPEGMDTKAMLDLGTLQIDDDRLEPCSIICYTAVATTTDARGEKLKGVKFYVRGYDSKGQLLEAGPGSGKRSAYVEIASDTSLLNIEDKRTLETESKSQSKSQSKSPARGAKVKNAGKITQTLTTEPALPVEKSCKTNSLWLIENPPCPTALLHYSLPVLLIAISIVLFLAAQMQGFDMHGQRVSSGSKAALYLSGILLLLAILALWRIYTLV